MPVLQHTTILVHTHRRAGHRRGGLNRDDPKGLPRPRAKDRNRERERQLKWVSGETTFLTRLFWEIYSNKYTCNRLQKSSDVKILLCVTLSVFFLFFLVFSLALSTERPSSSTSWYPRENQVAPRQSVAHDPGRFRKGRVPRSSAPCDAREVADPPCLDPALLAGANITVPIDPPGTRSRTAEPLRDTPLVVSTPCVRKSACHAGTRCSPDSGVPRRLHARRWAQCPPLPNFIHAQALSGGLRILLWVVMLQGIATAPSFLQDSNPTASRPLHIPPSCSSGIEALPAYWYVPDRITDSIDLRFDYNQSR